MKDKQKEIEEMADILCQSKNYKCDGEDCKCIKQATDLYNADYRNCKDKVALSMEEFDEFRKDQAEVKFLKKQIIEQASKETAREILNMGKKLYEMSYHKSNAMPRLIEWIKVEYGVEVE